MPAGGPTPIRKPQSCQKTCAANMRFGDDLPPEISIPPTRTTPADRARIGGDQ
jgi:hypothetical protein